MISHLLQKLCDQIVDNELGDTRNAYKEYDKQTKSLNFKPYGNAPSGLK
jgi:hypothetical protein